MYEDERCTFYLVPDGDRVYLHTKLVDAHKPSNFKHFRTVLECLEVELLDRGVDALYTTADSQMNFAFCESMGFETTEVTFFDKYEIMKKCL